MVPTTTRWLLPAALCVATLAAAAQTAPPTARPDPQDAKAGATLLRYDSPFAHYRRWRDDALTPWREANETVTRIGGWRSYAREAQAPSPATPPAAAAAPMPAPADRPQPMHQGPAGPRTP